MLQPGRPRHEQISDWLRRQIADGTYRADQQLPSESSLVKQFGVSRITIRRAMQTLENEGLIYRRQGLGSFVQSHPLQQGLVRLTDFIEDMARAGLEASSRVVYTGTIDAPADVAEILALAAGTPIQQLDRLRLGDDEPIAFDQTWLPMRYGHLLDGHDLATRTIYSILETDYGIPVLRGRYRIVAVDAPTLVARHLNVDAGRAVLLIERVSFTLGDRPIYFQRRYYRSDRVVYELELARRDHGGGGNTMPLKEFEPVFKV